MSDLSVEERLARLQARRGGTAVLTAEPPAPLPQHRSALDPAMQERLARLQNRRSPAATTQPQPIPTQPEYLSPTQVLPVAQAPILADVADVAGIYPMPPPTRPSTAVTEWLSNRWSPSRIAAAGASAVSFASMIVAMGPLLKTVEGSAVEATTTPEADAALDAAPTPVAPDVAIQSDPVAAGAAAPQEPGQLSVSVDGAADAPTEQPAPADGQPSASSSVATDEPAEAGEAPVATAPAATTAPETAAPATAAPDTAAPDTASPDTAAPDPTPATAAPTTAPPTTTPPPTTAATAPPTTAPPTTVTEATPPPKSDGSG